MAGYHNGTPVGRLARYVHIVSFEQVSRFKESKDSLLQFIHKGTCNLDHDTRWRNVGHLRRCQLKRYGIHNHAHCCPYVGNTVTVKPNLLYVAGIAANQTQLHSMLPLLQHVVHGTGHVVLIKLLHAIPGLLSLQSHCLDDKMATCVTVVRVLVIHQWHAHIPTLKVIKVV